MNSKQKWVLGLAAVGAFMTALDTVVVSTALSTLRTDLHASVAQLEWTVNAYNLSFAVLIMTAAGLGDRFGRRLLYATGLALFTVASAACAIAPSIGVLIAARALQGAGAAAVMTLGLALVSWVFPPERRSTVLGILGGLSGLAVASGPLVGGAVVDGIGWEWIFWLNVPIGLLALPLVLRKIDENRGADVAIDVRGLALVTSAAFGIVWGLVRGNTAGWNSAEVLIALAAGVALLVGFVSWERRAPAPMLPLDFFRSRSFSAGNAAMFSLFASLFGAVFIMAQFFQTGLGHGPLGTGLRLLPWTGTVMIVSPIAGKLGERFGDRPFMVGGLLCEALGLGWIALIADPGVAYSSLVVPLIVAGSGVAMAIPACQNAVVNAVGPAAIGKASGTIGTMRELGGVFGIATVVAVFAGSGSYASPQAFADGFAPAIGAAAALALAGALVVSALTSSVMVKRLAPAQ
jgi:EmrB/QacA subfamily drug resistance transporter